MSELFNTIEDVFIMAGKEIESTAKDVTAKAKLKYEIKQREGYLDELYKEIGKEYYQKYKEEMTDKEAFTEITSLLEEVADLKEQYMKIKGTIECPQCGAHIDKASSYCKVCGKQLFE